MDAPILGKDLNNAASGVFSLKNILMIVFTIILIMLMFRFLFKQDIVDSEGNVIGSTAIKFRKLKKEQKI